MSMGLFWSEMIFMTLILPSIYAKSNLLHFLFSLWNYRSFPRTHWRRIRTTNGLERINKELKRRTRVVGAFPSDQSFMRLGVSILIDINEEWLTTKKYL